MNKNIIKHGTWAISNLCRGKPIPPFSLTKVAIPVLIKVQQQDTDCETLQDALWALSYLTDGDEQCVQMHLDLDIQTGLIRNLNNNSISVLIPTIRCIGNLATGSDQ